MVSRAGDIAFKDKTPFTALPNPERALAEGQATLLAVVDGIERGEFPVRPDEPFLCSWCAYAGVCRKDYVGDEGSAPAVQRRPPKTAERRARSEQLGSR